MNKEKILLLLGNIVEKDINEINNLPDNTNLSDIGLNSIRFIQLIVAIEEEFDIEINDSDLLLSNFETLELLYHTLQKYFNSEVMKKVLILDCDNVLWHGISGEEEISTDETILHFQNELVSLYNKGILLCLCSKNEQTNIDEAFNALPMIIIKEYIALEKINLNDKASNIKSISEELNLSLDSFVFIDDSDYEIGLINAILPEIETVKADYSDMSFINKITELFGEQISQDLNRTKLYKEQKKREKAKLLYSSVEEYNNSLETEFICTNASIKQSGRISELSKRTNQFNLTSNRYSNIDIENLIYNDKNLVISLSVKDKYGDMGIVSAAVMKIMESNAIIESFFLSCRVFGRGFEAIMLDEIKKQCGNKKVYGVYVATQKNGRYSEFYPQNGVEIYEL